MFLQCSYIRAMYSRCPHLEVDLRISKTYFWEHIKCCYWKHFSFIVETHFKCTLNVSVGNISVSLCRYIPNVPQMCLLVTMEENWPRPCNVPKMFPLILEYPCPQCRLSLGPVPTRSWECGIVSLSKDFTMCNIVIFVTWRSSQLFWIKTAIIEIIALRSSLCPAAHLFTPYPSWFQVSFFVPPCTTPICTILHYNMIVPD